MMGYGTTNRSARVRQTVLMGLMFALAMVLSYVESMITVPGLPPGVKLGTVYSSWDGGRPIHWLCSRAVSPCSPGDLPLPA